MSSSDLEDAYQRCARYGRARDRERDTEIRTVDLTDDEAAAVADFIEEHR